VPPDASSKLAWETFGIPTARQLVGDRAVLWNLRTIYKLKLPHLAEGGADYAAATERQEKKTDKTPQPTGETNTEPLLIYQHQEWMLKE
jgi:hypothetical protein